MTVRGYGRASRRGGGNPPLQRALRKFGFFAPLTEDVFLDRGYGAASFTRATVATVKNHEGGIRNCVSGEVRFHGQRRVHNNIGAHTTNTTSVNGSTSNATFSTGVSDPDGGTLATTLTSTLANGGAYSNVPLNYPAGTVIVVSVWVRRRTGTGNINLTAGGAGVTNITSVVTASWQRISAQFTATGASPTAWQLTLVTNGDAVDLYKLQSEIVTGQSNQNPSEYVSVGATKLNELVYSEEFDNAAWTKTGATVTRDASITGPAGAITNKLVESAGGTLHEILKSVAYSDAALTVSSFYLKAGTRNFGYVSVYNSGTDYALAVVNLTTGVVTDFTTGASTTGAGYLVEDAGNGWWRVSTYCNHASGTWYALAGASDSGTPSYSSGRPSWSGDGASYIYLSAGQMVNKTSVAGTYFPVGSVYPYHGACVDGVRYFDTLNGNTVASNVVTEATGAAITRPEDDGLTNGLVLPGAPNNYASIADSVPTSITGDIDLRVKVFRDNWAAGVDFTFIGKLQTAGQYAYDFYTTGVGNLYFRYSPDGTALRTATSSVATGLANDSTKWLRATYASATGKVNFYLSDDGVSWTPLGTEQTLTAGAIFDGNTGIRVGVTNDPGNILYRAIVKNGIDGTTVFDCDFTAQEIGATSFTESSSNAATVTVNTSGTVPAYIGNPLRLFNYEGYLAESARTNLVLQSSNFGTTWGAVGTPTRSAAAAYCGEIALDLIGDDAGSVEGYSQIVAFTGDATKSVSFLVKQGTATSTVALLQDSTGPTNRLIVAITWSGGVPVVTYTTGSAERASEYMGNGVWRIFCLSSSITAANTNTLYFYPATTAAFAAGDTGTVYIGGVQAENATTASASHIPTTTATVTRNADLLTYPATGNAANATASLYAEGFASVYVGATQRIASISATVDRMMDLYWVSSTAIAAYAASGGLNDATAVGSPQRNAIVKAAAAITTNDAVKCINGALGTPDATVTPAGTVTIITPGAYGSAGADGVVRNVRVAATRVSDADLQLITQ